MRAAVVGCGVAGMASAVALARQGIEVTLFEAFDQPRPLGSGLLLQPSGLAALRALGLDEAVRAAGARVERLEGRDLKGRLVLDLDYARWRDGHGIGVHRAVLFNVLFEAVRQAGVEARTNRRIIRVSGESCPTLEDAQGEVHGPFDLAVVADGSAGTVRQGLRPRSRAPVYPWGAVWANAPDPDGRFAHRLRQVYHRAEVMIGALPVGAGPDGERDQVSLFWSVPVAELDAFRRGDFEAWRTRVKGLWPAMAPLVDHLDGMSALSPAIYRDVSIGRWSAGGAVILGDAAHGTSPQMGQGANLGLVDAVELGLAMAARRSRPVPGVLLSYQARRRLQTSLYQVASRGLTPMFQSKGRFWPLVRDIFFVPFSRAPIVRNFAAGMLAGTARLGFTPKVLKP